MIPAPLPSVWLLPSSFHPHSGGVEELTLQLAQELGRLGHAVLVVTNRHPLDLPPEDVVEGVSVVRVPFPAPSLAAGAVLRLPADFAGVAKVLMRVKPHPDLLHVQCPSTQLPAAVLVARLRRAPLVVTTQGEVAMDADQIYQRSLYLRTSLKVGSRLACTLTACSRWAADEAADVAARFRLAEVIPNGIDPDQWEVTPLPNAPIVAAWGRHVHQKGFDLLIQAWPDVRRSIAGAQLLIGGAGPETEGLKRLAGDGVTFLGQLNRAGVARLLAESRVVVVPSRLEPFGIVALEAMACGRGVVWSNRGGLASATGGIGWPVDPENRAALSAAITESLRAEPEVERGRHHAELHSWHRLAGRYRDVYERCLMTGTVR